VTEIGIVVAEYTDGCDLNRHFGDYAEKVLKRIKYHNLWIRDNAHLMSKVKWMRGAEGDRFGRSRIVMFAEARTIVDEIFNQPIVSDDSNLAGLKRPVVLVGCALRRDKENIHENLGANLYERCV
jgi:hypothetical protein